MTIIATIIIIGIIIFVHELGHYIFAKLAGCGVEKFTIGWGPQVLYFRKRETKYGIGLFPLIGGYINLYKRRELNRKPLSESARQSQLEYREDILSMKEKYGLKDIDDLSPLRQFLIYSGGILTQFLSCFLILSTVTFFVGFPRDRVEIAGVAPNSPAELAGIKQGDIVTGIDGNEISTVEQLVEKVSRTEGRKVQIIIERQREKLALNVVPTYDSALKRWILGMQIYNARYYSKQGEKIWSYIAEGFALTINMSVLVVNGIWRLITHQLSINALMGPVGIVGVTSAVMKLGVAQLMMFIAFININLAIINSLPFPALDGGQVLILAIERAFKIKIKESIKGAINLIGFSIIIFIMLIITYRDILNLLYKS